MKAGTRTGCWQWQLGIGVGKDQPPQKILVSPESCSQVPGRLEVTGHTEVGDCLPTAPSTIPKQHYFKVKQKSPQIEWEWQTPASFCFLGYSK